MTATAQFHAHLLCLYVADPATFPASNNSYLPSENSFFIQLLEKNKYFWVFMIWFW